MAAASTNSRSSEPLTAEALLAAVKQAGIVGMGGAGFPAHVKFGTQVDTVLANGAECEPLLWSDKHLMIQWPSELIAGVALVMEAVGAERGIIAVKGKVTAVVEALEAALRIRGSGGPRIELYLLRNFYPAGDEFSLVQQVLGRTIPEMGLPLHRGVVVSNVASLRAVTRAVRHGEPSVSRLVSVVGEVRSPVVVEAPIGAPIAGLLEVAGGPRRKDVRIIDGGPMMGRLVTADDPVMKTTSGLVVLGADHSIIRRKLEDPLAKLRVARAACCSCMACTEVCPRNALGHRIYPHRLMQSMASGLTGDSQAYLGTLLCCECGLCTVYGCPLYLDPCQMNIEVKQRLRAQGAALEPLAETQPSEFFEIKQVPVSRLVAKLQIREYLHEVAYRAEPVTCDRVTLRLQQGVGKPSQAVVKEGERVALGQLVAEPGGPVSAALHASIAGIVERVDDTAVVLRRDT